jgi:hypothetical protein
MARKSGSSFGNFAQSAVTPPNGVKPITTEFSQGSVPDSLYTINRESAWSRWRRGYELATATTHNNDYSYQFDYEIPNSSSTGNDAIVISGAFTGYPTISKEFGMHWAIWRYAGSVRCDRLTDPVSSQKLFIESVTEDASYWYVKLAGTWSPSNPLPAPFYIPVPGEPDGLKPANTEIFEDRIITVDGPIIDKDTINPQTQTRYGYVQAVVIAINQDTGVLTFKKDGSVQVTPDGILTTPSSIGFTPGRYLITGSRYCCTCQDFTRRDYSFLASSTASNKRQFPRSSAASIKPGRFELTKRDGILDNSAMTRPGQDRTLDVVSPEGFELGYDVTDNNVGSRKATRDNPGVFRDFGSTYVRSTTDIAITGSRPDGIPGYQDYSSVVVSTDTDSIPQVTITAVDDSWAPLLDELRYCKHIYALKFKDRVFPPEPSDFPVGAGSMAAWEQTLVAKSQKEKESIAEFLQTQRALSLMDVPPYNCQSPMIFPMLQRIFNFATDRILIENFTMFDKDGRPYKP